MREAMKDKLLGTAELKQYADIEALRCSGYFTERFLDMENWRQVEELISGLVQIYAVSENIDENDYAKFDGAMRVINDLRSEL